MSHHRGSSNPKSNITEADIIAMRELRRDTKETLTQIGARASQVSVGLAIQAWLPLF